ncbi:alpha/beta hydrolase [Roseomonas marmotae]|uniref:Alpha/beta hydrolase n=1 Tax=Roseomonas marmotae TaxID=2768161 RepID=A0ABS3KCT7_9PROT|nr:alpha/beta hydrolase [Roseomonas marmotae]MBO1075240.1 alpha/beta hydrolase [Roseomonas marmotae]QTI79656.1 alpha/beta hydrolase [Roseomonas marmotae]
MTYRDMDRATLDREYNARATVPDIAPIMAEYRARTEAARRCLSCVLDIPYGPTEPERLDVFPAAGTESPAPVFVYIHGGYWRLLDAADSGFMAPALTAAGICVVVVNYALAPGATLDEIVRQCRAALAWVHGNIAAHGGDPARIHVGGSSAGGHLAAMLAAGGDWPAGFGLPPHPVAGATLLSGLFDLEPLRLCHVNDWMTLDAAAAARNSPALLPPPRQGMPVVLSVAETETAEFKRQTRDQAGFYARAGCPVTLVPAPPGSNHFDIVFQLCGTATPLGRAVLAAIRGQSMA